jgi:hypothetical protein
MKLGTLIMLMALVTAPACGGGGGSDSGVGPSPTPLSASFVADQPTPGAKTVSMLQASKSNDVVNVYVSLTETSGVYGTAFEVMFDPAGATFVGFAKGAAFEVGGSSPNYTVDGSSNPGRIVVGVARTTGTVTNIVGSKAILTLQFRVKTVGAFPVTLQNGVVYDGQAPPKPISSIQWFAGAITGV